MRVTTTREGRAVATEVRLPEIGESVTEGTIITWLVGEGERVEEDQPLFEISTDKIDTEVPSPARGVLKEIRARVDETVEVGEVVAVIADESEVAAEAVAPSDTGQVPAQAGDRGGEQSSRALSEVEAEERVAESVAPPEHEEPAIFEPERAEPPATRRLEGDGDLAQVRGRGELVSPLVRRLIEEHNLDPSSIKPTGRGGRITREDVERAIQEEKAGPSSPERLVPEGTEPDQPTRPASPPRTAPAPASGAPARGEGRQRTEPLTRIRKIIARHMMESLQTTAQLTATVEADATRVVHLRDRVKEEFQQREGIRLSPLPFVARAVCMVLPHHEKLNASIDTEAGTVTYYGSVNLGIAVDTPEGLIVPNVKGADDLTVPGLARAIADLAERARSRRLKPDEVSGGTFTLTNTGSRGVLFDTPILNPPEVAILATPRIEKRPIVVETPDLGDSIAIRWMTYLCLTYDHRLIDGADAARFLADLKAVLEEYDFGPEVGLEP
ncbi:MAG: 2-oxoglutarate dehydrogenase, E2 component, dihydrolipoamide succinyltransferase [Nitriliruptorales bacterium]